MIWREVRRSTIRSAITSILFCLPIMLAIIVPVIIVGKSFEPVVILCCLAPILLVAAAVPLMTLLYATNPREHPLISRMAVYGLPHQVADAIDAEALVQDRVWVFGPVPGYVNWLRMTWRKCVVLTPNWIVQLVPGNYLTLPSSLIVWVYLQLAADKRKERNMASVVCHLATGTFQTIAFNNEDEATDMLEALIRLRPELLTGYHGEWIELDTEPAKRIEAVHHRRELLRMKPPAYREAWIESRIDELETFVKRLLPD